MGSARVAELGEPSGVQGAALKHAEGIIKKTEGSLWQMDTRKLWRIGTSWPETWWKETLWDPEETEDFVSQYYWVVGKRTSMQEQFREEGDVFVKPL